MLRSRVASAAVCALALGLTGCGGSVPETAGTAIELPELPFEDPTSEGIERSPESAQPPPDPDDSGMSGGDTSQPADTSTKDCVIVAAGVSSILLAPLSFMGSADDETVERLHDQIDDVRSMVPAELVDDFDRLQEVAAASAEDSGSFDESSYLEAVAPIEEWLHQHCNKSIQ
ncbi:hypothetical protein [Arthrobacter sp. H20]|uniref:hypothetical protein n=1 Tax=Arthrobacter sp. H20 TaxID=1267981 RepID=UPI0012DD7824|nr:hypothetical protein [Arthrobacter sp. H20]